ncbi:hypothetical protein B0H14DRAFT_2936543 [Mycena olivaceomarginata]|nr:hypothetical protein B0H14DRAFT_2936543 [Mycena olivaceomarginata]
MRSTILVLLAASATSVMAGNCHQSSKYCGRSLLYIGDDGAIDVLKDCGPGRCHDAGAGKDDYCTSSAKFKLVEQYAGTVE